MDRKKNFVIVLISFLVLFFSLAVIQTTFGWMADTSKYIVPISGSSLPGYFGGGDGTENNPYLIKTSRHLYNLSWLQYQEKFTDKTYFKLSNDIDMQGQLMGTTGRTGAIPPIGTESNPFIGEFNGSGYVISNLWVSSNPLDWAEKPRNFDPSMIGTRIGFFGSLSQETVDDVTTIGYAYNFVLENYEVTSDVVDGKVGLVAGYVNANMEYIGIKNGKITLKNTATTYNSLVGSIGQALDWEDLPSSVSNGTVKINPTSDFTAQTSGVTAVPSSTPGSAYYCGNLSRTIANNFSSTIKRYNDIIYWQPNDPQAKRNFAASSSTITTTSDTINEDILAIKNTSKPYFLNPNNSTAPTYNSTVTLPTLPGVSTSGYNVPNNSVWFKPFNKGVCHLVVIITNNSKSSYMSLYSYKRDNTPSNGILTSSWREIQLEFTKNVGNGSMVVFDIDIPQSAIDEGYEFVVGKSTTTGNNSSGFGYLILAGAGREPVPGDQTQVSATSVDFVGRNANSSFDILDPLKQTDDSATRYKVNNVLLSFNALASSLSGGELSLYFNKPNVGEANSDKVLYYGSIIQNAITSNTNGQQVNSFSDTIFPPRQ